VSAGIAATGHARAPRILISAYGCEPGKGSEQGVGWNWSTQLAQFAQVVVLTRSNNREAIEAALQVEHASHIRFEFYDLPDAVRRLKRKEKGLYLYYLLWQWGAYRRAQKLVRQTHFDYVMHLSFGSIWMPTFMHRLGYPFIWGPVGGGEAVPFNLISALPLRGRLTQYLRYVLMKTVPANPFIIGIIRRAAVILARTEDTARLVPARYASKVRVVLETAMDDQLLGRPPATAERREGGSVRVIYTGRLVPFKHVEAGIHAVARARQAGADLHFVIVGGGPLRAALEELAITLGVGAHVTFRGNVSAEEVLQELSGSDIYLFPSLREGGVWTLMEAMALGLSTICVRTSGMAIITDEGSAIQVDPVSEAHMVEGFTSALLELAQSPERRRQLGQNARKRIDEHFRWRHKADFMRSLLGELERAAPK
jgi:glycosyltransferase involved in cell wall biosynthesis